jgi:hypothetical protein
MREHKIMWNSPVTIELSQHSTGPTTFLDVSKLFQRPAQLSLIDEAPLK